MRADRLVAALLVLQARGQVTAQELGEELEVSTRTARRDLEGLAMAGIPVYSQPGRGGGWTLIGGSRTDLSGLTAAEARTLFLVGGPPGPPAPPRHLEALQQAVIEAVQVRLGYTRRDGAVSTRVVHPLGLVVKNQVWYLIGWTDVGQRTFRVTRVRSVEPTGEPVQRPEGFDLAAAWRAIVTTLDAQRAPARVRVRADPDALDILRYMFGRRVVEVDVGVDVGGDGAGEDGQTEVEIRGASEEMVARQLAGLADRVEVRAPEAVRRHLAAIGHALVGLYGSPSDGGG
jgi:predicted DNA-binding transcriptional regulator YafY